MTAAGITSGRQIKISATIYGKGLVGHAHPSLDKDDADLNHLNL
jgi:hypothetical protein